MAQKRRNVEKKDWEKKREVSLKERGIEREKGKKKEKKKNKKNGTRMGNDVKRTDCGEIASISVLNERRLCLFELRTCKLRKHYVTIITNNVCPWKNVSMERGTSQRQRRYEVKRKDSGCNGESGRIDGNKKKRKGRGGRRRGRKRFDRLSFNEIVLKSIVTAFEQIIIDDISSDNRENIIERITFNWNRDNLR